LSNAAQASPALSLLLFCTGCLPCILF